MRALTVALLAGLSGCGYALLQTARPVPPGELEVTMGGGVVYNDMVGDRGVALDNLAPHVALRYGVTDNLDLGVALFMLSGALVDGKLNLVPPGRAPALSVQLGVGAALVPEDNDNFGAAVIHVPARLLASWDFASVTPYAGAGYGFFWVFGYGSRVPGVRYAARTGHGDGLLMLTGGVELASWFLLEYDFWHQLVDDPGDFHSFADNHLFSAGVRF